MSVVEGKRQQGTLKVMDSAYILCNYTISTLKKEKVFPKSSRWLISRPIADEVTEMLSCIRRANSVKVTCKAEYEFRRGQRTKAYACLEALLGLVDVAYASIPLDANRVEYWTGLILDTEVLLLKWKRSDESRYSKFE